MQPEDRVIHFSTELIHPPVQHQVPVLQRLYYELSQQPGAGYDNTDFSAQGTFRFHSRRQKAQSVVLFLPDRLVIIEEWADMPLSGFIERLKAVGARAKDVLGLKPLVAQTVTLRSTFSLTHYADATEFLLHQACRLQGHLAPHFDRPLVTGGLRFVFPETADHPGTLNVLVETFRYNPREVLVEVKGLFDRNAMGGHDMDVAANHVQLVRRFILDNVFPFLNQFDTPQAG
jgi:hypothetical protein